MNVVPASAPTSVLFYTRGTLFLLFFWRTRDSLSPTYANFFAIFEKFAVCNSITRQAIELENYSNPLRIQQVLNCR